MDGFCVPSCLPSEKVVEDGTEKASKSKGKDGGDGRPPFKLCSLRKNRNGNRFQLIQRQGQVNDTNRAP